eukprot:g80855.t1
MEKGCSFTFFFGIIPQTETTQIQTTMPAPIHHTSALSEQNALQHLDDIYAELDPPPPQKEGPEKLFYMIFSLVSWALVFGMPFIEDDIRSSPTQNWYEPTKYLGLPRMYGLVVIVNVMLASLYVLVGLGFVKVGGGRRQYGYKLPLMFPSIDIHAYDVLSGGHLLSGGDVEQAKGSLDRAANFMIRQRVHHNALESLPIFLIFSVVGGIRYPLGTAVHGALWILGRWTWTNGYLSGKPINRYKNPAGGLVWSSLCGLLACCIGLAIVVQSVGKNYKQHVSWPNSNTGFSSYAITFILIIFKLIRQVRPFEIRQLEEPLACVELHDRDRFIITASVRQSLVSY